MKTERASGAVSRKAPLKTKGRPGKKRASKAAKQSSRHSSWYDQVAPDEWIPPSYLHLIRRKRKAKKSIH